MADARPLLESHALYVDGEWVEPANGRYDDISPATEATIARAADARQRSPRPLGRGNGLRCLLMAALPVADEVQQM